MMPYSFIVVNTPLQYRRNNRIAPYCNYRREHFQYRPTLLMSDEVNEFTIGEQMSSPYHKYWD